METQLPPAERPVVDADKLKSMVIHHIDEAEGKGRHKMDDVEWKLHLFLKDLAYHGEYEHAAAHIMLTGLAAMRMIPEAVAALAVVARPRAGEIRSRADFFRAVDRGIKGGDL